MRLRPKPPTRSRGAAARVSGAGVHPPPPPPMARGGYGRRKVTPNLAADREGTRLLNLTVLRRLDPAVADILITAAHVTAYTFDTTNTQWSRKGVEGSLFVVKRNTQPRFQFVIMNRRNIENLVEDLLSSFEYQVQNPYIIYRNAADEVTGIWFYDPEECEEVAQLFSRIHNAFSRASPKEIVSATKRTHNAFSRASPKEIVSASKSFSDFEEVEVASSVSSSEDTQEQPTSSSMVPNDAGHNILSALLKAAACVGAPTGATDPVQSNQAIRAVTYSRQHSPVSSQSPALHDLLPSRTSSATVVPPDAHVSTSARTTQPSNLTEQLLFPQIPIPFSQPTTADAAFASSAPPPLHPPFGIQHRQSTPLHQPLPLSSAPPLHPQHQQSARLLQLFPQSTVPAPLHHQHQQSDPLLQPFRQSPAPPPLHPQHRQSDPLIQPFRQSPAPPPLHPQHRHTPLAQPFALSSAPPLRPQHGQTGPLAQPFALSSAPPLRPQRQQSAPLLQHFAQPTAPPPLHPQHQQSDPLLQPFPQCSVPPPPYGALLLQPLPPPNPSPLLAPTASHGPILSRDRVRDALLNLVQNEDFIDMFYWELIKGKR
ncbi:uncharacterized protein [Lolium perenne]|uniref:uncharacterized protein isoform X1 n=1 Tax=Lolium perenne TaxID=4522 RepID=UPI0021F5D1F0|nr:mRNA-decapping enzyme-like protein isoform X1 [Lolium perenne]